MKIQHKYKMTEYPTYKTLAVKFKLGKKHYGFSIDFATNDDTKLFNHLRRTIMIKHDIIKLNM